MISLGWTSKHPKKAATFLVNHRHVAHFLTYVRDSDFKMQLLCGKFTSEPSKLAKLLVEEITISLCHWPTECSVKDSLSQIIL